MFWSLLIQAGLAFLTCVFITLSVLSISRAFEWECGSLWHCTRRHFDKKRHFVKGKCKTWRCTKWLLNRVIPGMGMVVLSIASAVCYFYDVLVWNRYDGSKVGLKLTIFIVGIVIFILVELFGEYDGGEMFFYLIGSLIAIVVIFGIIILPMEKYAIYNMKVIEQSPKVETYQYEVISASDGTNIEGSISGESSGKFFLIIGSTSSTVNGEIKQTDVYKFYYVANGATGEIRSMTLDKNSTPIFYVEEGEKPYLLKTVTTPYSLDYNVDPPKECNVGKQTITYKLYIPKGSIVGNFEFSN